ncbi:TetR/AcrR family transcriptional regulator [Spirochaeta isovalerica]|uniref:AcrR family transcriptional regulator n=1 Tax=Spirochaeta isovalerica TaxID=150 RepID=A0A841R845_9SPIO|nr:TetR/AcrR family transcriptional regulator [Spirochaeta isovalerica]MBB6479139.1 AcrR family transcriptional regulator [Spirochaeta isovalerica]
MKFHNDIFDRISIDKKERILNVATEEFSRYGYSGTNVNVIAEKLEVSVGSLYKYFTTKENIFLTVINRSVEVLESTLDDVMNSGLEFFEKIEKILRIIQEHSKENPQIINLYNELTTEGNTALADKLSHQLETVSARCYRDLIKRAVAEGSIDPSIHPGMFAFCLDNLFLTLQFSYASEYYRNRMKIYIGDDWENDEMLVDQIMKFIRKAFT